MKLQYDAMLEITFTRSGCGGGRHDDDAKGAVKRAGVREGQGLDLYF